MTQELNLGTHKASKDGDKVGGRREAQGGGDTCKPIAGFVLLYGRN